MDQPTAGHALKEMEVLVGEWSQQATPVGDEPWPGEAQTTFEWLEGGQLLLERSTVEMPEAPNGVCVYGRDAANRTGNSIEGRWEYDEGNGWQTDFDLVHTGALGSLDHVAGAGFQVAAGAPATKAANELGLVRTESAECC